MALLEVTAATGLSVVTGTAVTALLCVGPRQVSRAMTDVDDRVREVAPYLGAALALLAVKQLTQGYRLRLSRALDWNITDELYALEGGFVAGLQRLTPEATLEFFTVSYMIGFAFLLVAAPVTYFLSAEGGRRYLKELLVAYMLNYAVGTVCYTLFISYGPRNHLETVSGLMYRVYPQTQDLTAAVASNTNVFPSLHTSLSVAVLVVAWRSRRTHPRWTPVAAAVATAVVFSTMYLGIHWLTDVVVGVALGVGSVIAAARIVDRAEPPSVAADGDQRREPAGRAGDD
ncbi:phosphoesterase PA-phosphatase-like protein [Halorubrum coriense DSM 10284]|uniref:Phosphoesterase PA-phosphatase-like protein n=1 Tax=Halorubrum coriense DSM 10284 TaxID=1227466 RepID=M0EEF6_9EURY|nr:phosphatase PAP2 family protein [Halorubrum coriense]ELZ46171.1 phosphoesterase PA-phosphatase-like protein [Halorubrum coriense DSM 10284]